MQRQIPEVVVSRLPMYVRALTELHKEGIAIVNSRDLGDRLGIAPAQIRKDLSYFGRFGRRGRGYNVALLLGELSQILGLDRQWRMAVVGVGRLGRAIMDYKGFVPRGFKVVAAFDKERNMVGRKVSGVTVRDMAELEATVKGKKVDIAIVAVPSSEAQEVIDRLVQSGVRSILNYAPISGKVPPGVRLEGIDPVLALQSMTYYLARSHDNVG
jgi:redox-sensing transcriptional repressor